jgi:hypothetical protein
VRQREVDLELLRGILSPANEPEVTPYERCAFGRILGELEIGRVGGAYGRFISRLTVSQRIWAQDVAARLKPLDSTKVLRGREVEEPAALRVKPLKPPVRRTP